MRAVRAWFVRLGEVVFKQRRDAELAAEMESHLQMHVEDGIRAGMMPAEARRHAVIALGGVEQTKESYRDRRGFPALEAFLQDARFGLRMLSKNPGFTAVAVLTLALGIGANTAIFSLIDAVMLRMLPVRQPQELVLVADLHANPDGMQVLSNTVWEAVRDRQDVFSGAFAWSQRQFNLAQGGEAHNADGLFVSGDYFNMLGVQAAVGRLLSASDDFRGCPGEAVLSYAFWQSRYGGNPNVVDTLITLDDHPFQVVGVSGAGFFGVVSANKFDIAIPICSEAILDGSPSSLDQRSSYWLRIMGRLKPGVSAERASAQLRSLSPSIFASSAPQGWEGDRLRNFLASRLEALPSAAGISMVRSTYERPLQTLMIVVGLVLLIACANIACLLLARATARKKEIAVRLAVGASRWRLIRQLFTECLLVSLAGAFAGLFLARWGYVLLVRLISAPIFSTVQRVSLSFELDWRVLGFTAGVAVLAGLLFGIFPSILSTRASLISAMKGRLGEEAEHRRRFYPVRWIVAVQASLSLVLVLVAGLFLQSFWKLTTLDTGFDRKNVLLVKIDLHNAKVPEAQRSATCEEILNRLGALPGVTSVSQSVLTPIMGQLLFNPIHSPEPNGPTGRDALVFINFVSPGYSTTLGTPLLSGRDFTEGDTAQTEPVSIINQTMARRFFPGDDPVGKYFTAERTGFQPQTEFLVIGVAKDVKFMSLRDDFHAMAYFPASRMTPFPESWNFEMRTALRPSALESAAGEAVGSVNKAISVQFSTLEQQVDDSITQERLLAVLSGFFGALAVLLAMIGLYGVLSYTVAQRTHEIGVRMALGAQRSNVLRMVLRQGATLAAIGVAIGLVAALGLTRLMRGLLYGVSTTDPLTFAGVAILMMAVALVACYIPARRAMRVDPAQALRHE